MPRYFVTRQRDVITAASVVLVQMESPLDAITHALQLARDAGCLAMLNPAPANAVITAGLLTLADVLTPNETEFAALLEAHIDESIEAGRVAEMDDMRLHGLCRRLLPHGSVIVTLGATGALVSHPDAHRRGDAPSCYRIGAEAVATIDTTGAGDAFNGALAASLAGQTRATFSDHVRFANRYAALSTQRSGAANAMPYLDEVNQRFTRS